MADGRTWLVRRAERLYGPQLGQLQHSELSWHILWKLTTHDSPDQLVTMIQRGLAAAGVPDAAASAGALPPAVVSSSMALE